MTSQYISIPWVLLFIFVYYVYLSILSFSQFKSVVIIFILIILCNWQIFIYIILILKSSYLNCILFINAFLLRRKMIIIAQRLNMAFYLIEWSLQNFVSFFYFVEKHIINYRLWFETVIGDLYLAVTDWRFLCNTYRQTLPDANRWLCVVT